MELGDPATQFSKAQRKESWALKSKSKLYGFSFPHLRQHCPEAAVFLKGNLTIDMQIQATHIPLGLTRPVSSAVTQ
jgi:hypothetical protein